MARNFQSSVLRKCCWITMFLGVGGGGEDTTIRTMPRASSKLWLPSGGIITSSIWPDKWMWHEFNSRAPCTRHRVPTQISSSFVQIELILLPNILWKGKAVIICCEIGILYLYSVPSHRQMINLWLVCVCLNQYIKATSWCLNTTKSNNTLVTEIWQGTEFFVILRVTMTHLSITNDKYAL